MNARPDRPRDILLVHNGASRRARETCTRAQGIFSAAGYTAVSVQAPGARELTTVLTETLHARSAHIAAVVAVGGDGMAHLVLQVLHALGQQGVDVAFGLIPAGSGNDLARFCGIPTRDAERAAGRVLRGLDTPPVHLDLLEVSCADGTSHVCATTVSLGLDAVVNARANRLRRLQVAGKYAAALVWEILRVRASDYSIDLVRPDGTGCHVERRATFLSVTNTSSYGGGLTIVPRANPRDGQAELFAVCDAPALRILFLLPRLLCKTHETLPEVSLDPILSAHVTARETESGELLARTVHGDGEPLGPLPARVRLLPSRVRVLF